jgi:hypothetical protein
MRGIESENPPIPPFFKGGNGLALFHHRYSRQ